MVDIKYDAFEKKRKDKIAVVKAERNTIIQYADRKMRITSETSPLKGTAQPEKVMDAADFEEMRMEALKRRQEKELNKIVEKEQEKVVLQLKIKRAEDEEIKKQKEHAKRVAAAKAEEEKKQAARELERKRKEEEEVIARREVARKEGEFNRKMAKIQLETEKRLKKEAIARDMERTAKIEELRKKTEAVIEVQIQLAEKNRLDMLAREARVKAQMEKKKEDKRIEVAAQRAKSQKRIEEALGKYEEIHAKKRRDFEERQAKALQLAKENAIIEREKVQKAAEDRHKRAVTLYGRLCDAYSIRNEKRQSIIDSRDKKDYMFEKIAEDRNNYTAMLKFSTDLKLKDKLDNVERIARVNEYKRLQTLKKIEDADLRYDIIQTRKEELNKKHRDEVKSSLYRKHQINDAMEAMRVSNDFTALDKLFASKKPDKGTKGGKDDDKDDAQPATA